MRLRPSHRAWRLWASEPACQETQPGAAPASPHWTANLWAPRHRTQQGRKWRTCPGGTSGLCVLATWVGVQLEEPWGFLLCQALLLIPITDLNYNLTWFLFTQNTYFGPRWSSRRSGHPMELSAQFTRTLSMEEKFQCYWAIYADILSTEIILTLWI